MTDNQFNQLFDLVTKSVNGIQRLEKDVVGIKSDIVEMKGDIVEIKSDIVEMKGDISELKQGQIRIEKEMLITNKSMKIQQGDVLNIRTRLEILEDEKEIAG